MEDGLSVHPGAPMARHSPWRTGGAADVYVVAHTVEAVAAVQRDCKAVRWRVLWLGAGTRTLFRDGPIPGAVVRLGGALAAADWRGEEVWVGGGFPMPALLAEAARRDLTGLSAWGAVPGSFAASLLFDEGWTEVVRAVRTLRRGKPVEVSLEEARRRKPVVLGAHLVLQAGRPGLARRDTHRSLLAQRPCPPCSWFQAPKKFRLRDLLRSTQLPLVRLREAAIPTEAPEVLVNLGGARGQDLALLQKSVIDRVKKVRGIQLVATQRWVGTKER